MEMNKLLKSSQEEKHEDESEENFVSLIDDNFFENEKFNIDSVIEGIEQHIYKERIVEFDEKNVGKTKFHINRWCSRATD